MAFIIIPPPVALGLGGLGGDFFHALRDGMGWDGIDSAGLTLLDCEVPPPFPNACVRYLN